MDELLSLLTETGEVMEAAGEASEQRGSSESLMKEYKKKSGAQRRHDEMEYDQPYCDHATGKSALSKEKPGRETSRERGPFLLGMPLRPSLSRQLSSSKRVALSQQLEQSRRRWCRQEGSGAKSADASGCS